MAARFADLVLVVHALVALFIGAGLVAIWFGAAFGWRWVRNRAFRWAHIAAIVFVAATSLAGMACPLTVLEDWLRGEPLAEKGFIERWVGALLYYDLPVWMFTIAYTLIALLTAVTWRLAPPDRRDDA